MSSSIRDFTSLETKLPPILRMPPEIILQIFKTAERSEQKSLASTCSSLSLIGSPEIFRTLTFRIFDDSEEEKGRVACRALAASRRAVDVRSLFILEIPSSAVQNTAACLDLFTNLTFFATSQPSPLILFKAFHHNSLSRLCGPACSDFLGYWWDLNDAQPLPRRDEPLRLRPLDISTVGQPHEPDFSDHCWTGGRTKNQPSTEPFRNLDWFFNSTTATNVFLDSLQLIGLASIPFPPSGFLSTSKLPSLGHLDIMASEEPTLEFLESLGVVALVQSPNAYLAFRLATRHPLRSSLGALGRIAPFEELAGISGWENLGMGQIYVQFDGSWGVSRLQVGLEEGLFSPSFLTSTGTSLRNLTTLILDMNPDCLTQTEPGWPADWNTVVEAFKTFQSLTFLTVPPSLTPEATYTNDIACSDASFARLSSSHPLLHQQALDVGGWWLAWKRLGWRLNLSRLRRLGASLPEGCVVEWGGPSVFWEGKVVTVEGGRRGLSGKLTAGKLSEDADGDPEDRHTVHEDCSRRVNGWRCFSCGGVGQAKDLWESARLCGDEEVERALNDEWRTTWTEDDVKAELALERSDSTR